MIALFDISPTTSCYIVGSKGAHTAHTTVVRMNSNTFGRMHSYKLSNYTYANANVYDVTGMLFTSVKFVNKTN